MQTFTALAGTLYLSKHKAFLGFAGPDQRREEEEERGARGDREMVSVTGG